MYDIIIIGAGASGLMAAWDLSVAGKKVAVVEAKNRIGGRIFDIVDPRFTSVVELGAEFIHGDLELTKFIGNKANAKIYERTGEVFKFEDNRIQASEFIEDYSTLQKKFKQLDHDISVQEFLDQYLSAEENKELRISLQRYVEGYYAADPSLVSTFALRDEFENSSDIQYGIKGGYTTLIHFLEKELKENHCDIFLSSPVSKIEWEENNITVKTNKRKFKASKLLVTVSVGVLQSDLLQFTPNIPEKIDAAKQLGFGNVIKIVLQFQHPFWKQEERLKQLSFLFSEEKIPTWWTSYPKEDNMLVGWLGGPDATDLKDASENE